MKLKDLNKLNEGKTLLTKLSFHFKSQAKKDTPKCNEEYYRKLGCECFELLKTIDNILGN